MEVNEVMDKHFNNLGLEFGDTILVGGNGFSNQQGIFIAFQDNFLVWVTFISGATRLLSTDTTNLTIARA